MSKRTYGPTFNGLLIAALSYAARGLPVFPCHPETKRPLVGQDCNNQGVPIPNSGGLKQATTDQATIESWWGRWPLAMIGVTTGDRAQNGCGAFVLDLDVAKGVGALATGVIGGDPDGASSSLIAVIEEKIGQALPDTAISRTGSGGLHIWFATPDNGASPDTKIGNRAGLLKDAAGVIDVRGNGGYVIAPPSVRADGAFYEWVEDRSFATAPDALIDLVCKRDGKENRASHDHKRPPYEGRLTSQIGTNDHLVAYARGAFAREIDDLRATHEGGRNHRLNQAAFALGTLIGAGVLDALDVRRALEDAADHIGLASDDGWPSVRKTIESGLSSGIQQPRDLSGIDAPAVTRPDYPSPPLSPEDYDVIAKPDAALPGNVVRFACDMDEAVATGAGDDTERASTGDVVAFKAKKPDKPRERDQKAKGGEDTGERGPRGPVDQSFSVDALNQEFALILMGSKAVILREDPTAPFQDRVRLLTVEAFNAWFSNRFVVRVQPDGKEKAVTFGKAWMTSKKRRQYRGVQFQPFCEGVEDDPTSPGYYNLFQGYEYKPSPEGSYAIFRDHLFTNICNGEQELFDYIFAWCAHLLQRPRERIGTALVFRGGMGSGKSTLGEVIGELVAAHYFPVDDPRYVTGNFNAHMASCLLLQAEEAVWAGDKAAEGRLKGLITSKYQMIEAKGIDPIRINNYVRVIMTSNEDWVVPAGVDERRFAVIDVADHVAQNHAYFAELWEEMENGGYEALFHDLMAFDLTTINLRAIPKTAALLDQKLESLPSVWRYWYERLHDGAPLRKMDGWQNRVKSGDLHDDYRVYCDDVGIRRRVDSSAFGRQLKKICPGMIRKRITDIHTSKRPWGYDIPPLKDARAAFEAVLHQDVQWPDDEDQPEERDYDEERDDDAAPF